MIKVGIIGGSGYVAGELLRCLSQHPHTTIDFVYSHSFAGEKWVTIHTDLLHCGDKKFTSVIKPEVDVVFLCLGHGKSQEFLEKTEFSEKTKIIDMSNDFRIEGSGYKNKKFVYGLVELHKKAIMQAQYIANPGCFATAIQLALLPLAKAHLLNHSVHIHAITGSTGAGRSLLPTLHFSQRSNNISIYKPFAHPHLKEIKQTVSLLQPDFKKQICFIPMRGNFTRGIFATLYTQTTWEEEKLITLYEDFYKNACFTYITPSIDLKRVVNTNHCCMEIVKQDGKVLISVVLDNLLKGAAGQAIQNMNLMFGLKEDTGLYFKASYF